MRVRSRATLFVATFPVVLAGCAGAAADERSSEQVTAPSAGSSVEQAAGLGLTGVPQANPKVAGFAPPTVLSPELIQTVVAQGANALENPATLSSGVVLNYYGYNGDGPFVPLAGDVQSSTHNVEAHKTEPDKNTYLVLDDQTGPDAAYDYGRHFLYQGHETGLSGYITRINLDADAAHRVTLLASTDVAGNPLPTIDGSTWDPWAKRLLFTTESGSNASALQATAAFPSTVEDISGALGRGGYEGIQNDSDGNLWIVEDVGGKTGMTNTHAKQPNSFLYRFVPKDRRDLKAGRLQALQVISLRTGEPIAFHAGQADADILSPDVGDLHTYGKTFDTKWVTLHDTDVDGTMPFDANALAKAAMATPFKRPENGQFRPDGRFREFFFDETGDTNQLTEAGAAFGGFGSLLKLSQKSPSADTGTLSLFYLSDVTHSGFDNCAFVSRTEIVFVEDAGDGLHTQRNALDSGFLFDIGKDYSDPKNQPVRVIAEGRDPSATIDSSYQGTPGFPNEGDNELTGMHVSDGNAGTLGILGARAPRLFQAGWRAFYTAQHGDNVTWEILPNRRTPFED
jgi:hypothetical protein